MMVMTLYFWSKFIKFCSVDVLYLCINIRYYHGRSCHISLYMNSSTSLHLWADKYLWIMLILLRIFTMQCPLPILYYEYCLFIFVFGIYVLFFLTCMYLNNALPQYNAYCIPTVLFCTPCNKWVVSTNHSSNKYYVHYFYVSCNHYLIQTLVKYACFLFYLINLVS